MSGFIALCGTGGGETWADSQSIPPFEDSPLGKKLRQSVALRGPDGQKSISCGPVWLCHSLLHTDEQRQFRQPFSVDGAAWIAADARLDGRKELARALCSSTNQNPADFHDLSDPELVLHAYHAWGKECPEHLAGDFSFVVWDAREHGLLCVRDPLGIKPLYFVKTGSGLAVSNTVQPLLQLPGLSLELNETAIADFLFLGFNQSCDTTFYKEIQRVPPGHALWWSDGRFRVWCYFELLNNVAASPLRYRKPKECIEEFKQRLDAAVADRLRNGRAAMLMSGGLDSTSVAAAAVQGLQESNQNSGLAAFTATYEQTCGDREEQFARLAAEALHIPLQCLSGDSYALFQRAGELAAPRPEPSDVSLGAFDDDFHRAAASHSRVALAGEGGDIGFHPQSGPYLLQMVKQFHPLRAASAIASSIWNCRRLPPLLMGFKSLGRDPGMQEIPHWIEPSFAHRNDLQARWRNSSVPLKSNHPSRPAAFAMLEGNFWPSLFESSDPGVTGILMEVRYPFLDLRLLGWLLSLPPVPWCVDKWLLRQAMRGKLPEAVRRRPKSPLAADPVIAKARSGLPQEVERMDFTGEIRQYISLREFLPVGSWISPNAMSLKIRAISLNYWLQNRHKLLYNEAPGGII